MNKGKKTYVYFSTDNGLIMGVVFANSLAEALENLMKSYQVDETIGFSVYRVEENRSDPFGVQKMLYYVAVEEERA